jgi:hypothetical protein
MLNQQLTPHPCHMTTTKVIHPDFRSERSRRFFSFSITRAFEEKTKFSSGFVFGTNRLCNQLFLTSGLAEVVEQR